jgi:hypothetical protein
MRINQISSYKLGKSHLNRGINMPSEGEFCSD